MENKKVKNPIWLEANQLAIYKRGRGFELRMLPRTNPASGQGQTWNSKIQNYKSSTLTIACEPQTFLLTLCR